MGQLPVTQLPIAQLKAELFKAIAHPVRVRVLEVLVGGERPVGELAETLGIEMSHLSQQLGILRRGGVLVTRRSGNTIYYSLRDPRMSQLLAVARQMLVTTLEDSQQLLANLQAEDIDAELATPGPAGPASTSR